MRSGTHFRRSTSKEAEDILRNTSGATLFHIHQKLELSNGVVNNQWNSHTQCSSCDYNYERNECKCEESLPFLKEAECSKPTRT